MGMDAETAALFPSEFEESDFREIFRKDGKLRTYDDIEIIFFKHQA